MSIYAPTAKWLDTYKGSRAAPSFGRKPQAAAHEYPGPYERENQRLAGTRLPAADQGIYGLFVSAYDQIAHEPITQNISVLGRNAADSYGAAAEASTFSAFSYLGYLPAPVRLLLAIAAVAIAVVVGYQVLRVAEPLAKTVAAVAVKPKPKPRKNQPKRKKAKR